MITGVRLSAGSWPEGSSRRGYWRGRVLLGAVLGITAGTALMAAPPVMAQAPTCEEPPMASKVLADQFKDVAPGVPYQAGVPPVKDGERPKGQDATLRLIEDQMGFIRAILRGDQTESLHEINRLNYSGCGEVVEDGHTDEVTHYLYSVSLHENAAREDVTGDGPGGKVHLIRVVRDNEAWDESSPGVGTQSADKLAKERELQLGRTPFGILNAIVNLKPDQIKIHDTGSGPVTLQLPVYGVITKVVLDRNYRPETVTQRVGRHTYVDHFTDYHDLNQYGMMIPRHIVETVDGRPHLTLHIIKSMLGEYEAVPAPAFERAFPPPAQDDNYEFAGDGFGVPKMRTPEGDTPRTADGHPDLNGFWGQPPPTGAAAQRAGATGDPLQQNFAARHGIFSNFENDYFLYGQMGSNIPLYKPALWAKVQDAQVHAAAEDPYLHCMYLTAPRFGPPVRILQVRNRRNEGEFVFFRQTFGPPPTYQDIPVGAPFFKSDEDGTPQGNPAAHWDGDTLVVETTGFDGMAWLGREGYITSYNLKTIERLRRQGNEMYYDVTVEDPDYMQRPWVLPTQQVQQLRDSFSTMGSPCQWKDYPASIGGTLG